MNRSTQLSILILAAFIVLASTGIVPIPLAGVAAAALCLATNSISLGRAVREVNWDVLGLLEIRQPREAGHERVVTLRCHPRLLFGPREERAKPRQQIA